MNSKIIKNVAAGLTIFFYSSNYIQVAQTVSGTDGSFSFIGLAPGTYTARLDTQQLNHRNLTSSSSLSFTLLPNQDGDVARGLELIVDFLPAGN